MYHLKHINGSLAETMYSIPFNITYHKIGSDGFKWHFKRDILELLKVMEENRNKAVAIPASDRIMGDFSKLMYEYFEANWPHEGVLFFGSSNGTGEQRVSVEISRARTSRDELLSKAYLMNESGKTIAAYLPDDLKFVLEERAFILPQLISLFGKENLVSFVNGNLSRQDLEDKLYPKE